MANIGIIGLILIIANFVFSYMGFKNELLFDRYKFEVSKILINKDYKRLFTSGFLHVSWTHLILNMLSLYMLSGPLEQQLGGYYFLIIYFASLIGGDLLALYVHKHHGEYSSVGASGAVCGIIFASIALFPGMGISLFGILPIPGWIFGLLYIAYSIYGIRSNRNNIGHEAHLGGALIGMLTAIAIHPSSLKENYFPILIIIAVTVAFMYVIMKRPELLRVDNFFYKKHKAYHNIDEKYNMQKMSRQKELDHLLDKISKNGIGSLTTKERQKLDEYSKR